MYTQITIDLSHLLPVIVFCHVSNELRFLPKHPYWLVSFCAVSRPDNKTDRCVRPKQGSRHACNVKCTFLRL
jgi:hypothetical protein